MANNNLIQLPKIDLHCHIDGSFSLDFVRKVTQSTKSDDDLIKELQVDANCTSLTEYLTKFDLPLTCMQTKENIELGILDVVKQAKMDNVPYIELRFAPTLSSRGFLTYQDIFEACVNAHKKSFEDYGVYSNIIVCAMRHHSLEQNLKMLTASREFLGNGICALDLAGDENFYPNELFEELFKEANRINMPFIIHSGECGSTKNVELAIKYGAKRIGHGIAMLKDEALMKECASRNIGVELCPSSNYQTMAISKSDHYPLQTFMEHGIKVSINTDNRTVSNTTSTKEYELMQNMFSLTKDELIQIYKDSVEISFASDNIKDKLLKMV